MTDDLTDNLTNNEAIRQTREWWDSRANTVSDLPEVVGVGRYELETPTVKFLEDSVVRMLSRSDEKTLCMDGGCGVGLAFPVINRVFPRIFGLDFSPNVIRRIPAESRSNPGLFLCNGSVTALPVGDSSLDAIHCRDLLQCLPAREVERTFAEFRRVLKPGGVVVAHFKNSATMLHRLGSAVSTVRRLGRRPPPLPDPINTEEYVPGDTYLRPWSWYLKQAIAAGLKVEDQFSWQLFFWGRLQKRGIAKPAERLERVMRRFPLTEPLIRHNGINYYVLLRKPK